MIDFLVALLLDFLIGDPYCFPHPVKLMGKWIAWEEKTARSLAKDNASLKKLGGGIVLLNLILSFFLPFALLRLLRGYPPLFHIVNTYLLYTCIAAGCLQREAMKIYRALSESLDKARYQLSFIVGRETKNLEEKEVIRATVETVAENTSDGVIAPMFYAMIGGVPLAFLYKMGNTMDSMLGYLNEKYRDIGFFPAKTDDVLNFLPARLTGLMVCLSSLLRFRVPDGFRIMIRDRKNHKSPNCAYPEGAVAGLLGVQLGGDNTYFGEVVEKPRIGDRVRDLEKDDIRRAVEIMYRSEVLTALICFALYFLLARGIA
jgi:adenosylcobinamide-phosphate synthase